LVNLAALTKEKALSYEEAIKQLEQRNCEQAAITQMLELAVKHKLLLEREGLLHPDPDMFIL
jgi:hypothetical protein